MQQIVPAHGVKDGEAVGLGVREACREGDAATLGETEVLGVREGVRERQMQSLSLGAPHDVEQQTVPAQPEADDDVETVALTRVTDGLTLAVGEGESERQTHCRFVGAPQLVRQQIVPVQGEMDDVGEGELGMEADALASVVRDALAETVADAELLRDRDGVTEVEPATDVVADTDAAADTEPDGDADDDSDVVAANVAEIDDVADGDGVAVFVPDAVPDTVAEPVLLGETLGLVLTLGVRDVLLVRLTDSERVCVSELVTLADTEGVSEIQTHSKLLGEPHDIEQHTVPAHGVCEGSSDGVGDGVSEMHWQTPSTAAPQLVAQHTVPAQPEALTDAVGDGLRLADGDKQMHSKLVGAPQEMLQQYSPAQPVVDGVALGEMEGVSEMHWQA